MQISGLTIFTFISNTINQDVWFLRFSLSAFSFLPSFPSFLLSLSFFLKYFWIDTLSSVRYSGFNWKHKALGAPRAFPTWESHERDPRLRPVVAALPSPTPAPTPGSLLSGTLVACPVRERSRGICLSFHLSCTFHLAISLHWEVPACHRVKV